MTVSIDTVITICINGFAAFAAYTAVKVAVAQMVTSMNEREKRYLDKFNELKEDIDNLGNMYRAKIKKTETETETEKVVI